MMQDSPVQMQCTRGTMHQTGNPPQPQHAEYGLLKDQKGLAASSSSDNTREKLLLGGYPDSAMAWCIVCNRFEQAHVQLQVSRVLRV